MVKNKILFQYTAVSLLAIIAVAVLLGIIISRKITDHMIRMHVDIYRNVIHRYAEDHPEFHTFFKSNGTDASGKKSIPISFLNTIRHEMTLRVVILRNENGLIVWSDESAGSSAESIKKHAGALNGETVYALLKADRSRSAIVPEKVWILKIYMPVILQDKMIGIVELEEQVDELKSSVNSTITGYWITIAAAGFVLYVSLFFIFYKANRGQTIMLKRLEQTQDVTIFALAYQAELRDNETGKHLERTSSYVKILAEELRKDKKYRDYLTDHYISDLVKSAPLHDIGKVGIPDSILRKPGKLTPEEFEIMKKHCEYGVDVLQKASSELSFRSFLDIAVQLAGSHQEKWDGSGYPAGLSGDAIPLSGRIMALADVYDAMRSHRPYKEPFPHERCVKIISESSGTHFDPDIVKAFLLHEKEFSEISEQLAD